jgi:transcriptional regulator with XRE-family HTH domain
VNDTTRPNVGARIRAIRESRGLSLRALAERCGLSANAISLIERGENSPTVSSLHQLAGALRASITDFFLEDDELGVVHVSSNQRLAYRRSGLVMESLGIGLRNQQLEPFLITVEPGVTSDRPVVHPGQEFVYCLEGEADYDVDGAVYRLRAGDSLLLDSTRPHFFRNPTSHSTTLLVVFQGGDNLSLARERHLQGE